MFWRVLFNYYSISCIIIKYENQISEIIRITEGVKQGGVLSPHLFNFFIDELIQACTSLKIGCRIGSINTSIVGYCDDIVLLSPTKYNLQILLNMCGEFGRLWRINFNPTKSVIIFQNWSKNDESRDFYLNGIKVQKVHSLVYLGLPIGDHVFKENYWDEKFKKVQKALYSLNGVGCRAFGLEPKILARLYSIYCQPIFNYGIELCHIKKSKLKNYDKSQACIIKRNIGLSKFTKNTALLEALKVRSISKIYYKSKILFYHQKKSLISWTNYYHI